MSGFDEVLKGFHVLSFSFKKAEAESRGAFSLGEEAKLQPRGLRRRGTEHHGPVHVQPNEVYWSG